MALIETKKTGGKGKDPGVIGEKKGRRRGYMVLFALGVTCSMLYAARLGESGAGISLSLPAEYRD